MKKFIYKNISKSKSVVVLGGGFSSNKDADFIIEYINKNNSTVVGTNYSYNHIPQHYTYFGDFDIFKAAIYKIRRLKHGIKTKNIIISITVKTSIQTSIQKREKIIADIKPYNIYVFGNQKKPHADRIKKIKLNSKGIPNCTKINPSGCASIIASIIFKPKTILISGIDGPEISEGLINQKYIKKCFDGSTRTYRGHKGYIRNRNRLKNKILPVLKKHNIKVYISPNCKLWNIKGFKYPI